PENTDTIRATGFLVRNWFRFNRNVWLDRTVEHTCKAFLGVTLNCARCHDHFFDPITQQEYYQFRAIFEPHEIAVERLPGEADVKKNSLPRVFDAHADTSTYLYVRGDDSKPDKSKAMAPATPAALGGGTLPVQPVKRPLLASVPGKREVFIHEELAESEQAIAKARAVLENAREKDELAAQAFNEAAAADQAAVAKVREMRRQLGGKATLAAVQQSEAEAGKTDVAHAKAREAALAASEAVALAALEVPLA